MGSLEVGPSAVRIWSRSSRMGWGARGERKAYAPGGGVRSVTCRLRHRSEKEAFRGETAQVRPKLRVSLSAAGRDYTLHHSGGSRSGSFDDRSSGSGRLAALAGAPPPAPAAAPVPRRRPGRSCVPSCHAAQGVGPARLPKRLASGLHPSLPAGKTRVVTEK